MGTRRYTLPLGQRLPQVSESEGAAFGGVSGNGVQLVVNANKMRRGNLVRLLETVRMHISEGAWPAGDVTPLPGDSPSVSVSVTGSLAEGGTMTVTVTASATSASPMMVDIAISGQGANPLNAADFGGTFPTWSGVTIAAGQLSATRTFATVDDADVEPDEGGRVTISNPVNCTLGSATADFTVLNNDAPPVPTYAVSIEANGWVLAVRGAWGATPGAWAPVSFDRTEGQYLSGGVDQFPLSPDSSPKVMLTVARQGYTRSGGQAVASSGDVEVLVATKALRRPHPSEATLDETDHGDGTRTVRLALSNRVYAGDSVTAVTFADGWKAGQSAVALGAIANNSARTLPVAISRWAQPNYTLVRNTALVDVDVIVAAHHPRHFGPLLHQAIAGMKLTATDGTTTKDFWVTAPRVSTQYGDNLHCWGAQIDLTGLTAGPVTIHRTEYPWIGAERSTGSGQSTDTTNGNATAWASPLVICYDPDGTLYPEAHVFVSSATGTTTPASVTVGASLSAAKAGTAAADISTAMQALYLANRALPARNGWAADTARAMDWATITLAAGVQGWGATTVTSGANCNEGRLVVQGDPDDASPRENCIWRTGSTSPSKQAARFWLQNLQVQGGEAPLGGGLWHLDNVEVIGKPGFEAATTGIFSGTSANGYAILSATRLRWWKYGLGPNGSNTRALLMRSCETSRAAEAVVHIGGSKIADPLFLNRDVVAFGTWGVSTFPNSDAMVWGCTAMDWAGRFTTTAGAWSSGNDTQAAPTTYKRFAIINSLCERSKGATGERIWGVGESAYEQMQESIFEGMTVLGNGWNGCYNDSPSPFVNLQHIGNVIRNCVFARTATKHDLFKNDGSLTGSWEYIYGVGFEGNVNANDAIANPQDFQFSYFGRRAQVQRTYEAITLSWLGMTDYRADLCKAAVVGAGNGDYRPATGSPMIGIGGVACTDTYLGGAIRGETVTSGAREPA
jgi:hypothetical protein